MKITVEPTSGRDLELWRGLYCAETKGQIVHDSLHRRKGWTLSHLIRVGGTAVGYGSLALAGPWTGRPTVFEFHILPGHRSKACALFEAYLASSGALHFEAQTNGELLANLVHVYGRDLTSDKIVFEDGLTTALPGKDALLVRVSTEADDRDRIARRESGSEWHLEVKEVVVATGGINFHYNRPYADVYMEVVEEFRRRGYGSYLVQELKRVTHEMGQIPCARCNPANVASRQTLQRAGFVPCGHILIGSFATS